MEIAITKMSTKGQIVIPADMREGINVGDKLVLIRKGDSIVLKKANKLEKQLAEDLEVAKRVEAAWASYDRGEFKEMSFEEFRKEIKKW
jgi:AbrB family looped-hinge helix DNA binding protein